MKIDSLFLDQLEIDIRSNKAPSLDHLIHSIDSKRIPRSLLARYANLVKRLGGAKYAAKLLNPIVRGNLAKASVLEITEYASCLTRLGLINESISLFRQIKDETNPEISYELAVAHLLKWDYHLSIPLFEKYISFPQLSHYRRCVGELNLVAALVYTNQLKKAKPILNTLLEKFKTSKYDLLCANILELFAEVALQERNFAEANKIFNDAREKLLSFHPRYSLFIEKGLIIVKMLSEKGSQESLKQCEVLRQRAAQIEDWNTLRDLELYKAVSTNDTMAINNLYYGISFPEYRKRILSIWGRPLKIYKIYERRIGPKTKTKPHVFDVAKGLDFSTGKQLAQGGALHRLLQVLTTDFYSPFPTTKLFSLVYDGVYYNPKTSPQLIYEIVKRTNKWFSENKIPLSVESSKSGYRLRACETYILRINMDQVIYNKNIEFVDQLKINGLVENFSASEIEKKLSLPRRSVTRMLRECIELGWMVRRGGSRNIRYSLQLNL